MRRLSMLILIAHLQEQTPVDAYDSSNAESDDQSNLDDDRQLFLGEHDNYRRKVALGLPIAEGQEKIPPKAANMMEMQYSCELEQKAVKLIESCPEELIPAPLENLTYNVDIAVLVDKKMATQMAVFFWASRYQTLTGIKGMESLIPSNNTLSALPFYIMMNAETTLVGCAIKKCDFKYYIACYYGDKLATEGVEIYKEGQPCSLCPNGTFCFPWEGLCLS